MKKLVFATNNKHKIEEVSAMLSGKFELLSMKDIHCDIDIAETADTFEGNALIKAKYIYENFNCDCFADDSGLEVEALDGKPGIYSARYAGNHDSDANMNKLLAELKEKAIMDEKAIYKAGRLRGEKEGIQKGLQEGVQKGIQKGITQGQLEKSIEIIKNLYSMNLTISQISQAVDMSEQEVQKIIDKNS